jgi:hypothetical protein
LFLSGKAGSFFAPGEMTPISNVHILSTLPHDFRLHYYFEVLAKQNNNKKYSSANRKQVFDITPLRCCLVQFSCTLKAQSNCKVNLISEKSSSEITMRIHPHAVLWTLALVPGASVFAQHEAAAIDEAMIVSREKRSRTRRGTGWQIGSRTPPDFGSRVIDLTETVSTINNGEGRKLTFDTDSFWETYVQNFDSMPSTAPSYLPSPSPSQYLSYLPSARLTDAPTGKSSVPPTLEPSASSPSVTLTPEPTAAQPNLPPVPAPTEMPVPAPTEMPVPPPTFPPTVDPGAAPTNPPVAVPTNPPVATPTNPPFAAPTNPPVQAPTNPPVTSPPVAVPTNVPVSAPTLPPVPVPTDPPGPPTLPPVSGPSFVRSVIQPVALQGGAEFNDPNSYQSRALARTEEQVGIEMMSNAKIIQYYALYCIYNSTNQVPNVITASEGIVNVPRWIVAAGWESTTIDPCSGQWFGISCVNDQVTDIDLFSNLLTGSFPPEVSLLAADGPRSTGAGALRRIDLFDNMLLSNNGDNSWWEFLGSNFGFLFFKDTAFSGPLGRLPPNIQEFDCSFTFTSGGLTNANFQGLNMLRFADFDGNAYNSSVPTALSSLQNLAFLYIVDGFISGDLNYMIGMPALREHWIDTNPGLGGNLPNNLPTVATLESFSITSCDFQGTIPASFGDWGFTMKQMWMYDNALTGTIPPQLGQLNTLRLLQLEGNSFVGSMPAEICANTVFPRPLEVLGADCTDPGFTVRCFEKEARHRYIWNRFCTHQWLPFFHSFRCSAIAAPVVQSKNVQCSLS